MKRTCKQCASEFTLMSNHVGYSHKCAHCNAATDVERVGAEIHWEGKHTPVIEVVPLSRALKFNRKSKRLGASVLRSIVPRPPSPYSAGDRPPREEHFNNPGEQYISRLGEKHHTKR
jgi:hypothetical protein